ncbi:hypothetical protein DNE99_01725 [Salmonella enterica]|nr:hypothetical protein [Salmonella enterica]
MPSCNRKTPIRNADRQSVYDVCSAHRLCLAGAIATACQSEVLFHQLNVAHTSSFAIVVVYFFALKSARHVALFIKHQNQST